jgi:hypothetical protein
VNILHHAPVIWGALIGLGSVVSDIRGSIAGTTYSRNKGGAYARARVAPINRNTPAQSLVRANFAANAKLWSGTFTASERAAWTAFAAANPLVNILGASIIVSGLAMAQKLNQVLAQIEAAPITSPPPDLSVDALAASTGATAVSGTHVIKVTTDAQTAVTDADYYLFATAPLAPGKTPQASQYRFVGQYSSVAANVDIDFSATYNALFGSVWIAGQSIGVLVATVNNVSGAVTPGVVYNILST